MELRERAQEAHALAQQMTDPTTRVEMRAIARGYDVLADHAEKSLERLPTEPVDTRAPEHLI